MSMERATQDGYITHRSKHEKIIMYQPPWLYASSITQPSCRWSYQHEKCYARCLHHTPINARKDYHASTFMITRIKRKPTILALELWAWKELHKMVTSHTNQYTKRLSCINLHDHTHQAKPNQFGVVVIIMERATQDGYITHRSIHENIIMHQPSWSYASSITQPSWRWSYQHGKSYARWLHHTPINTRKHYHALTSMIIRIKHNPTILAFLFINMERTTQDGYIAHRSIHEKIIMHQLSWSHASSITQPSWRWSYQRRKSYTR